jgi:prolyl 4-hydroxylase
MKPSIIHGTTSTTVIDTLNHRITCLHGTYSNRYSFALAATSKSQRAKRNVDAIGFGSSSASKRNTKDSTTTTATKGDNPSNQQPQLQPTDATSVPLDKWGLPPPTLEDIFPLLSSETVLVPVDPTIHYTVNDTRTYLKEYYPKNIHWKHVTMTGMSDQDMNDATDGTTTATTTFDHPNKMTLRWAHLSPPVFMVDHFLTAEECHDVQRIVTDRETGSRNGTGRNDEVRNDPDVVRVASKTMSQQLALSKRTSTSWFCSYKSIPTVLAKLQHILGVEDLSRCEEPQIVRYDVGQEFTYHYDILPNEQTKNGGQRVATILIYLNTISETNGGSTMFRDLQMDSSNKNTTLSVQPVQGTALIFFPSNQLGQPDDRTLHRSLPIVPNKDISSPSKWILQIWIHESSYTACLPSNQNRIEEAYDDIDAASRRLGYIS